MLEEHNRGRKMRLQTNLSAWDVGEAQERREWDLKLSSQDL